MNMVFVCVRVSECLNECVCRDEVERYRKVGTERFMDLGKLNLLIKV